MTNTNQSAETWQGKLEKPDWKRNQIGKETRLEKEPDWKRNQIGKGTRLEKKPDQKNKLSETSTVFVMNWPSIVLKDYCIY